MSVRARPEVVIRQKQMKEQGQSEGAPAAINPPTVKRTLHAISVGFAGVIHQDLMVEHPIRNSKTLAETQPQ